MGLKPPRGQAKPIHGAVSQPKATSETQGVHGTVSKAQEAVVKNIGNSSMPPPKPQ